MINYKKYAIITEFKQGYVFQIKSIIIFLDFNRSFDYFAVTLATRRQDGRFYMFVYFLPFVENNFLTFLAYCSEIVC